MRFAERELKTYAEPVSVADLKEGSVYFAVNYLDSEMLIPCWEPVVYVGKNLRNDGRDAVYFQDAESYLRGVRHETAAPDEATFYSGAEPKHIFEYERALDCLLKCALRRQQAGT